MEALLEMRGPARTEPIPFERGLKGRPAWEAHHSAKNAGLEIAASGAGPNFNGDGRFGERAKAMATVQEARAIVNNLDPLGVGARDLRECLLIQIAAQRREAEMVLKRAGARTAHPAAGLSQDIAHAEAEDVNSGRGAGFTSGWA